MVPEENFVFDPEYLMRELVRYTHYLPNEWKGKLHSQKVSSPPSAEYEADIQVHGEFGQLFQLKVAIFAREILSVVLTPFILWFSLPACSGAIIDFFREFTVHVDGVGYVCSFAVFDFHRHGAVGAEGAAAAAAAATTAGAPPSPIVRRRDVLRRLPVVQTPQHPHQPNYMSNEHKMEKSFLHFKATHPDWQPSDPSSSVFLDRLMAHHDAPAARSSHGTHAVHGHIAGSVYAGGRGLGLGLQLGGRPLDLSASPGEDVAGAGSRAPGSRWFQPADLAPMAEAEGEECELDGDGEAEAMGWNRHIEEEEEDEGQDRGLLRDAGDILRQVMNR